MISSSQTSARLVTGSISRARAYGLPAGVRAVAAPTNQANVYRPLRVTPSLPQTLQWLTPGMAVTYEVTTTLDWWVE